MAIYLEYLWYVMRHKWFVFVECCQLGVPFLGLVHDWSKLRPSEFLPYAKNFCGEYPSTTQKSVRGEFDVAWLHHQRRNKHHWEYWVLVQDEDEEKILPMPKKYVKEMIADWRGAGRAKNGHDDTAKWYAKNKGKMKLHPRTRRLVEDKNGQFWVRSGME